MALANASYLKGDSRIRGELLHHEKAGARAMSSVEGRRWTAVDHRTNLRAAGLTAAAVSLFAVSDAVIKLLTAAYPTGQILFGRGVFALLLPRAA